MDFSPVDIGTTIQLLIDSIFSFIIGNSGAEVMCRLSQVT
jgi:hypothetical protein